MRGTLRPGALALAALGLALGACSRGDSASAWNGVIHLDPRLADGRSAAAVLDATSTTIAAWPVRGLETYEEDLGPWSFVNAGVFEGKKAAGVRVRAAEFLPDEGKKEAYLTLGLSYPAEHFNAVEVDVVVAKDVHARLRWKPRSIPPGFRRSELEVTIPIEPSHRVQTLRFPLMGHAGWRGTIEGLSLYPVIRGAQAYELHGIRLLRVGFDRGHDPGPADGGLLGYGADLRRTWPSDAGVPLHASVESVPAGGRVVVDTGVPGALFGLDERVSFAVDARRPGGAWEERARRSVVPADEPEGAAWTPLVADIADLAGGPAEVRLRGWLSDGEDTEGELELARLWWGAPIVFGDLPSDRRPNVLLVTIDTLRADALGAYGGRGPTPFFDDLAADSILYLDAWSGCNSTLPSHASILTGLDVPAHGVKNNRSTLAPEVPTLAEALSAAGYETAAAVSVHHLQAGYSGLGRGFDRYRQVEANAMLDGAVTVRGVEEWLESWGRSGERPFFLWVHLFDPHTPYGPPDQFMERFVADHAAAGGVVPPRAVDPPTIGETPYTEPGKFFEGVSNVDYARFVYAAGVAYSDEVLADLVGAVRDAGQYEETALVVTADHGESLGEHGVWFNHQLLYPPVMHVPLLLRLPGEPRGVRVEGRASNVDIAHTLYGYLNLEGRPTAGHDLLSLARGGEPTDRRVYFVHGGSDQVGCRDGLAHYARNLTRYLQLGEERATPEGADFLYLHGGDPACVTDVSAERAGLAAEYARHVAGWLEGVSSGRHLSAEIDAEAERRLDDLGYVGEDGDGSSD